MCRLGEISLNFGVYLKKIKILATRSNLCNRIKSRNYIANNICPDRLLYQNESKRQDAIKIKSGIYLPYLQKRVII